MAAGEGVADRLDITKGGPTSLTKAVGECAYPLVVCRPQALLRRLIQKRVQQGVPADAHQLFPRKIELADCNVIFVGQVRIEHSAIVRTERDWNSHAQVFRERMLRIA